MNRDSQSPETLAAIFRNSQHEIADFRPERISGELSRHLTVCQFLARSRSSIFVALVQDEALPSSSGHETLH
jgi:hypothetical protein